jgi:hypothetical protein
MPTTPSSVPTIVWVPKGAQKITMIAGPRAPTTIKLGRRGATPAPNDDVGRVDDPNEVARREEVIHIYVRAAGFPDTERLLNHLVALMRVQLTAFSFRPMSTAWSVGWPTATNEPERDMKSGTLCILECTIAIPFTFESQTVVRSPIGLQVTGEFEDTLS